MRGVHAFVVNGVHVRIRPAHNAPANPGLLLGFAKREPFRLRGLDILEPGDVWFQFGYDAGALIDALVAEVKAAAPHGASGMAGTP